MIACSSAASISFWISWAVFTSVAYREVIARILSQGMQDAIPEPEFIWQTPQGQLDMDALLHEFQDFWGQHAEIWEEKADYTEAFPHLLLMAFLQRVVNGGGQDAWPSSDNRVAISRPGQVEREYAAGRGRMDLAILYGGQWNIIEIKLVNCLGRRQTIEKGLQQITRYRDSIDRSAPCFLVVFDRTPAGRQKSWKERLSWEVEETPAGSVTVVGG